MYNVTTFCVLACFSQWLNHSRIVTSWNNQNNFEVCFMLYSAIFASKNSVIMVSYLESNFPFLQILIYNFFRTVSVICLNSSAEMYSITEGECLCLNYVLNWQKGVFAGDDISLFSLPFRNIVYVMLLDDVSL